MSPATPARRRAARSLVAFVLASAGAGVLALTGPDDASARPVDEVAGALARDGLRGGDPRAGAQARVRSSQAESGSPVIRSYASA